VQRAGLPFAAIHSGGLHGVGWRLPANLINLAWGLLEAWRLVQTFRPNALLVTGGFITVPVALAAWAQRVPILLYLPDIEPTLSGRFLSRLAQVIAVTNEAARPYFSGAAARKVTVTGYPTRPELQQANREAARAHFGIDPHRPTILITGGSLGARSLNRAVFAALPDWLPEYSVIHLSGQLDWAEAGQTRAALPVELRRHYQAFPFLHEMGLALAAADLVVSRAGASTLGEYPLFGLPAILVPYPHAWRTQKINAAYLVERGAALSLPDEALNERLRSDVRQLLSQPEQLAQMRAAARAAATPQAAARLAELWLGLGNEKINV